MNIFEYKMHSLGKTNISLRKQLDQETNLRMLAEDKLKEHLQTHTCISDKRMAEHAKEGDTLHIPIIKPYATKEQS